jgi:hypothetical protein
VKTKLTQRRYRAPKRSACGLCKPQKRGWEDKRTSRDVRIAIAHEQEIRDFEPYDEESGEHNCCWGFAISEWQEWSDIIGAESIAFESPRRRLSRDRKKGSGKPKGDSSSAFISDSVSVV